MSKYYVYLSGEAEDLLLERLEQEGGKASELIRHYFMAGVGVTEARRKIQPLPEQEMHKMLQRGIAMEWDWWYEIEDVAVERRCSIAAVVRDCVQKQLGLKTAEIPQRVPRNPELSQAVVMEEQAAIYNEMREHRESGPKIEPPWSFILDNPTDVFTVCDCLVDGCKENGYTLHKHANRDLVKFAENLRERTRPRT